MARAVVVTKPLPKQAVTAGPRVTPEQKRKIREALTSPDAAKHIGAFLTKYADGLPLETADPTAYRGHHTLLRNEWGFGEQAGR